LVLAVAAIWSRHCSAQESSTPQTARQALLEMFSADAWTSVRHLPIRHRAPLSRNPGHWRICSNTRLLPANLQTQGTNLQTFETGSVLLSGEDPKTGQKVEVHRGERRSAGDQDDIELSFQTYKNGEAQRTPFMPRMTFSMKQEAHIWSWNEISVTVRLPLADPDC